MTITDLIPRMTALAHDRAILTDLLQRVQDVNADADDELKVLLQDNIFKRQPASHHKAVREDLRTEKRTQRLAAAGVALFTLERQLPRLDADLRTVAQTAQRIPDAVDTLLRRTGGSRSRLSDEAEHSILILDELRRQRVDRELASASPAQVHRLYADAVQRHDDEAWSIVRAVEAKHGTGWAGPAAANEADVAEAVQLRTLMIAVQQARVPPEVAMYQTALTEASRLVQKAANLHRVRAINPDQLPDARQAYEQERSTVRPAERVA